MPLAQSLSEVELIRGGSSLLYGPQPAPVINLISHRPKPGAPLSASTEQVVGNHGLYSTYNAIEGSQGRWTFRADAAYVRSDGTRPNAGSQLRQGDLLVDYRPSEQQHWWLDLHAANADSGDAGRLSYPQWQANPHATPTPVNRDWVDRYQLVLGHQHQFDDRMPPVYDLQHVAVVQHGADVAPEGGDLRERREQIEMRDGLRDRP